MSGGLNLVNAEILAAFDHALAEHAPAVREQLVHPGLSESEIRALFTTVGVQPSDEALAWWRYFDKRKGTVVPFTLDVLPDFEFASVAQSVAAHAFYRQIAEENAEPGRDPEQAWATQWIPIFGKGSGGLVALDCRGPAHGPSPVRTVRSDTIFAPDHAPVIAPSLGELLVGASRWMQRGTCRFEPERRLWWPLEAWVDVSDAELYGLPDGDA